MRRRVRKTWFFTYIESSSQLVDEKRDHMAESGGPVLEMSNESFYLVLPAMTIEKACDVAFASAFNSHVDGMAHAFRHRYR